MPEIQAGDIIRGHYRIARKLSEGGQGIVYEAEEFGIGRRVALKFLAAEQCNDPDALDRFKQEAHTVGSLNHANICTIYEIEQHEGRLFIAMEFLEGDTLEDRLANELLDTGTVISFGIQIAEALHEAHANEIIHRDIKPANIFVTNKRQIKLLDFGLALISPPTGREPTRSRPGPVRPRKHLTNGGPVGTFIYMSPEQVKCEPLDCRTDLFSLGVVLYEMATGRRLFQGEDGEKVKQAILTQPRPSVPGTLGRVVKKALETDRNRRYQSAAEMKSDLTRAQRRLSFRPKLVGMIVALLAVAFLFAYYRIRHSRSDGKTVVLVEPLQNNSSLQADAYLRFWIRNEVEGTLREVPSLAVYTAEQSSNIAPDYVVTGDYFRVEENLQVNLNMDKADKSNFWHDSLTVAPPNKEEMSQQIKDKLRKDLVPALEESSKLNSGSARSENERAAYDLYIKSVALSKDRDNNKVAIGWLNEAVNRYPGYAAAWVQLGLRYYYDAVYFGGGKETFEESNQAFRKALKLDPSDVKAAAFLATNWADQGEIGKAYRAANDLLKRRPDNAYSYFAMSYVYRYAGLLNAATRECEKGLRMAPGDYNFRSCAWAFMELGNTVRARDFVGLDAPPSDWTKYVMPSLLLREGKKEEAIGAVTKMHSEPRYHRDLLAACLQTPPASNLDQIVKKSTDNFRDEPDPETLYYEGSILWFCGQRQAALTLLNGAIDRSYCAYEALTHDPLLKGLPTDPEFPKLLTKAEDCQKSITSESR